MLCILKENLAYLLFYRRIENEYEINYMFNSVKVN